MRTLKPIQRQAALLLATGKTSRQVAKELKINKDTLGRWKTDPQFMLLLESHLKSIESDSISALHGLKLRAAEKLGELLEGPPSIALKAASTIFSTSQKSQPYTPTSTDEAQQLANFNEILRLIQNHEISNKE